MRSVAMISALALSAAASAAVVTEWDFNGGSATTVPGGSLSPTPSMGAGVASLIGGVTAAASFGSGTVNGGSSDPVITTPSNYGWQTTTYAAQGAENNLRGTQYMVSTLGWQSISVEWDLRHSNTSSAYEQFMYTLDGVNFTSAGLADNGFGAGVFLGNAGDTWFNNRVVDLSGIAGAANNANFGFRVVATFAPGTGGYIASNSTSTYSSAGTWRFDMVQLLGTEIPTPGALALLGLAAVVGRRRR